MINLSDEVFELAAKKIGVSVKTIQRYVAEINKIIDEREKLDKQKELEAGKPPVTGMNTYFTYFSHQKHGNLSEFFKKTKPQFLQLHPKPNKHNIFVFQTEDIKREFEDFCAHNQIFYTKKYNHELDGQQP